MRYVVLLLICCWACGQPSPERQPIPVAEDSTFLTGTFYLVRHAEQFPGHDTSLTEEGHRRAGSLYRLLKDSGIQKIYFTPYRRSIETADSLREYLHIDTVSYRPDSTGESLLYEITRRNDWGKHVLVIGHSNTLLPIMRSLKAKPKLDSIKENDYSNLFIVKKYKDSVKCKRISYE
ncbi:histidine phosphatase family protein [Chitinophaga tropicalis]|uniref:Phosphoglycerate mutase n=1 Tax=Chitinophaga tropicalis TaxID=2683588 RepID=A0A7K1U6W5_9BACT|nr:histidine phosphatase family protein [Chitinophaga tropicalis]MVT10103.1 phosphoglycerate mutase [Chitinophaga tropicalis]